MSEKTLRFDSFFAAILAICTKAPYLPTDSPAMIEKQIPIPLAQKVFQDMNFYRVTPAKIALSSGTPDPSASLLMYSLYIWYGLTNSVQ
jgi:hypothetical protein